MIILQLAEPRLQHSTFVLLLHCAGLGFSGGGKYVNEKLGWYHQIFRGWHLECLTRPNVLQVGATLKP